MSATETSSGITPSHPQIPGPTYHHVVAGMHIGQMAMSVPQRFSILTVAQQAGTVPDHVPHRHRHLSYFDLERAHLDECVTWVLAQMQAERPVLIRSEGGKQRPALVAGIVILRLGGFYADAINCVRKANPHALTDFRYMAMLRDADVSINARLRQGAP